ncbi:MAG: TMEM175 family protein, partial [Candidatus Nanopelagicales bacterium]
MDTDVPVTPYDRRFNALMSKQRTFYRSERLGALTDGLFAIVLTLLVLELKIPEDPAPGT